MALNDFDLLNPQKDDELTPEDLALLAAHAPEPVVVEGGPATAIAPVDGLAKLRELVAARSQPAPGPSEEQRYMSEHQPQAGWKNVMGAVGSAIAESTGTKGALDSFHRRNAEAKQRYQEGLEAARGIDLGKRPIDAGTAELLVLGGMSPESAAQLAQSSQALPLARSGMGQLAARYRQQDLTDAQKAAERELKPELEETRQMNRLELEGVKQTGRKELKSMPKPGGGGGGGGGGMTPEERQSALAGVFAAQTNIPKAQVASYLAGNREGMDPSVIERLQNAEGNWKLMDNKHRQTALTAAFGREGTNVDTVWRANESKKSDPKALLALKNEIDDKVDDLKAARAAWAKMSPEAKQAMAKYGGAQGTLSKMIKDMSMSEQDRMYASEIQNLANALIKAQSGAAVSEGEWGRLASRMGFAEGQFDVMNSPATIDNWLKRMSDAAVRLKQNAVSVYGDGLGSLFKKGAP